MSARILNAQGILSSDVPTGNLVWVDAVNGVDALAVRGRVTIPFKTLGAAKNAAQSGDTIVVLPGNFNEKNLLKNGVNWHFMAGVVINYTGGAAGGIFDTSANGANGAVTSLITGHGEFTVNGSDSTNHVVHASGSGVNLTIQARRIYGNSVPPVKLAQTTGTCQIEVLQDVECTSSDVIVFSANAAGNSLRARDLITSGGRCIYVSAGSGGLAVTARRMTASAGSSIEVQGSPSGSLVISAYEAFSQSKPAVFYDTTSGLILTILGARLVSQAPVAADGRAVYIGSNSSHKLKLVNCVLIASSAASESIYSSSANVNVQLLLSASGNKDKHANVLFPFGDWAFNSNIG